MESLNVHLSHVRRGVLLEPYLWLGRSETATTVRIGTAITTDSINPRYIHKEFEKYPDG